MTEAPRRNRVDPWGDLHAVAARGLFTGNRGCLVDDDGVLVRHHRGSLWITCALEFKGWRHPLAAPNRWTPLFFLDDAVALAAGHRPCGLCRRHDYEAYRRATVSPGAVPPADQPGVDRPADQPGADLPGAAELNRALAAERSGPGGRGLVRAAQRRVVARPWADLPDGTVVVSGGGEHAVGGTEPPTASLVLGSTMRPFRFDGWGPPQPRPAVGAVGVLTPPSSLRALAGGFSPRLHPSATG